MNRNSDEYRERVAKALKLKALGLSQAEIAERMGVTKGAVVRWFDTAKREAGVQ